eukprot:536392_1
MSFSTTVSLINTVATNDSVDHEKAVPFVLEFIILWCNLYGIAEIFRSPKFIYVFTSLIIIVFIICAVFVYGIEWDQHEALDFERLVMFSFILLMILFARINVISKNETIEPYFESAHFWFIWISDKIFGSECCGDNSKGLSWFLYLVLFGNVLSAAIGELGSNKLYLYNGISGLICAVLVPMPLCYDTDHFKVDGTHPHDLSWNLHIGWITLYTTWHVLYMVWNTGVHYGHIVILSVAYVRALMYCRNDLWFHTRIVSLSLLCFLQLPISFYFDRWWFYYVPWKFDESQILNVLQWVALAIMIYAVLFMVYALYFVITNRVQSVHDGDDEEESEISDLSAAEDERADLLSNQDV